MDNNKIQIYKQTVYKTDPQTKETITETTQSFKINCEDPAEAVNAFQETIKLWKASEQTRKAEEFHV